MALTSGTKLGPYEVVSPLGAGGMGEVYRARDTRLEREVAVNQRHAPRPAAETSAPPAASASCRQRDTPRSFAAPKPFNDAVVGDRLSDE
jgi:serine/threonine protein kinase